MRRLLSIVGITLLAVLFATSLSAQKVSVGLKGGVNLANMTGAPDAAEMSTRFVGGPYLVARLSDVVSFMPELLYSQKGIEAHELDASEMVRTDYIELPLLFRFSPLIGAERRVVPFAMLGPAVAFNVKCQIKGESPTLNETADCDDSSLGSPNTVDFGVVGGIGTDFIVRRGALSLDARYSYGLNKVFDRFDDDWHHSVFSIMVGYRFTPATERLTLTR